MVTFQVDERIQTTSAWLIDCSLSRVFLKNEANFLWFILVPRVPQAEEIYHLNAHERNQLMEEIAAISSLIKQVNCPDKLNVAAIGNIVSQLHVHIVARYKNDPAWPQSIWQSMPYAKPYEESRWTELLAFWRDKLSSL